MKYKIDVTNDFKKVHKKIKKQNKKIDKLSFIVNKLANDESLEPKYKDHQLTNSKKFSNCQECYIEPDWLLVYRKSKEELILLLIETGSHSELF